MERQVEATPLSSKADGYRRFHWRICDNGMTVAEGTVQWNEATGACDWEDFRPAAEYEGQVRSAIAHAAAQD
jgi:hypothetical protein